MSLDLKAHDEVRDKLFMRLGVSTSWGQVHDELIGRGVMVIGDARGCTGVVGVTRGGCCSSSPKPAEWLTRCLTRRLCSRLEAIL